MSENCNFPAWDVAGENAMCFACARSGDKDMMCSWIKREKPVPGCVTVKASECRHVSTVKILRCPLFLPAKDAPALSNQEYRSLCHNLVVNLYGKVREDKDLLLARSMQVNALEEELKVLKKAGSEKKGGSG